MITAEQANICRTLVRLAEGMSEESLLSTRDDVLSRGSRTGDDIFKLKILESYLEAGPDPARRAEVTRTWTQVIDAQERGEVPTESKKPWWKFW